MRHVDIEQDQIREVFISLRQGVFPVHCFNDAIPHRFECCPQKFAAERLVVCDQYTLWRENRQIKSPKISLHYRRDWS
jgi:hypothetical protein